MNDVQQERKSGKLCRTSNGHPIIWHGHFCQGANLTPVIDDNFVAWTLCGEHDVPPNSAYEGSEDNVSCLKCKARTKAESIVTQMCVGIGQTVGFDRNKFLEDTITTAISEFVERPRDLEGAIRSVRLDLAMLLPDPENWRADQWPVKNPADAECLSAAYQKIEDVLGLPAYAFDPRPNGSMEESNCKPQPHSQTN